MLKLAPGVPGLDHVPAGHPGGQLVDLLAEQLDRVLAGRRPGRVGQGRRRHQQPGHVRDEPAGPQVLAEPDDVLGPSDGPGRHGGLGAAVWGGEFRRGAGRQVDAEAGDADVVGVDAVVELLRPGPRRCHVPELGDVDRRQHRLPRPVLPAVGGLDPGAPVPRQAAAG